jgi:predicted nucleotidyltransferase
MNTYYPTIEHEDAAKAIIAHFSKKKNIEAVLLVNSCARGRASRHSCLDIAVLIKPELLSMTVPELKEEWQKFYGEDDAFASLRSAGRYADVHLDLLDGTFVPDKREEVGEPDSFEIEIGNLIAYSVPLWQGSEYYSRLRKKWLPYYSDALRSERLEKALAYCLDDLDHVSLYVDRGLYFQAFERLHLAFKEFLQVLFISQGVYPVAYNKWIREQITDMLGMPELYLHLTGLFEIKSFESYELIEKAQTLKNMLSILNIIPCARKPLQNVR